MVQYSSSIKERSVSRKNEGGHIVKSLSNDRYRTVSVIWKVFVVMCVLFIPLTYKYYMTETKLYAYQRTPMRLIAKYHRGAVKTSFRTDDNGMEIHTKRTDVRIGITSERNHESMDKIQSRMVIEKIRSMSRGDAYKWALEQYASKDKVIILASIDSGFLDMAFNFYETSLAKHGITNYLFTSLTQSSCDILNKENIHCVAYYDLKDGNSESSYMSRVFLKKMALRTKVFSDALSLGYTIIQTDIDMIFLKNPLPLLSQEKGYIIQGMQDLKKYLNAGFMWIKSSADTKRLYSQLTRYLMNNPKAEDQGAINSMIHKNFPFHLVKFLDRNKFSNGQSYFEYHNQRRYFPEMLPSTDTYVVHNNYIVTKAAKIYRFKELNMWLYDGGTKYYTDTDRKYLTYQNIPTSKPDFSLQTRNLQNALSIAFILNRTLILPRFICIPGPCALNSHLLIDSFDSQFGNMYRESTFLSHPKVPRSIKQNISSPLYIDVTSKSLENVHNTLSNFTKYYTPTDKEKGATVHELVNWFKPLRDIAVLNFVHMHNVFVGFEDHQKEIFQSKFEKGFKECDYRQLHYLSVRPKG